MGWAAAALSTGLVARAFERAKCGHRPTSELRHHSDRSSQYASDTEVPVAPWMAWHLLFLRGVTQERFFDLAQRVNGYARRHPRRYRWKVALFAALGYTVLFGLMALCATLLALGSFAFAQPWFWETVGRNVRLLIVYGAVVLSLAAALFAMVRSLFVAVPLPVGRRLRREDAPELFAVIDEVVAASRAPQPHAVLITWDFNASVSQRPRFGWFGWTRDYLVLGVPLMVALSPQQFKAVLAHEFGHLRGGHGRFANWVYRLRSIWDTMLGRLARQKQRIVFVIARFLRWYSPRFSAYTYALARAQEFEADDWAVQVAGLPATGEALINIWTRGELVQEQFWRPLNHRACREAEVPSGVFAPMLALLRRPVAREDQRRWLRRTLSRVTDGTDTHPAPAERLAALGLPATAEALDADEMWPQATADGAAAEPVGEPSAADALLGAQLGEFLDELESSWRTLSRPAWRQRFERAVAARGRLQVLARAEADTPDHRLPEAGAWERARLELDLAGTPAEAQAAAARFVALWSEHALGQLVLGRLLLDEDDPAGVGHVETAMRLNGRLSADGEDAIAAFLRRSGQGEEAETRRRASVRHVDVLAAAQTERQNVTRKDRFLPHGLDEAQITVLRTQLARHQRVRKVWLARKEVAHHPEQPWYVLVCVFKWRWNEAGTQAKVQNLLHEIRQGLTVGKAD